MTPPELLVPGAPGIDFPSPLPFNKLGVADVARDRPSASGDVVGFFILEWPEGIPDAIDSAEPRLFCSDIDEGTYRRDLESVAVLLLIFGGWGKAAILTDRRTSLPGEPGSYSGLIDDDRSVGTSGVEFVCRLSGARRGRTNLEEVRRTSFDGV